MCHFISTFPSQHLQTFWTLRFDCDRGNRAFKWSQTCPLCECCLSFLALLVQHRPHVEHKSVGRRFIIPGGIEIRNLVKVRVRNNTQLKHLDTYVWDVHSNQRRRDILICSICICCIIICCVRICCSCSVVTPSASAAWRWSPWGQTSGWHAIWYLKQFHTLFDIIGLFANYCARQTYNKFSLRSYP